MEGSGGGGMGSIQQSMMASKMAKEGGGGGVVNVAEPVKGLNTSSVSALTGNIDQMGQQTGGAMGLLQGNVLEGMLKASDVTALGLPDVLGQMQQCQSELAQDVQKVGGVMRLEGVSPPSPQSGGPILSPDATPSMGHSAGHGMEH